MIINKLSQYLLRKQNPDERRLQKEVCFKADKYFLEEQILTTSMFLIIFSLYLFIYGLYTYHLFIFGLGMFVMMTWPIFIMSVPDITFRENSYKCIAAILFTYTTFISNGVLSPVMLYLIFLFPNIMPHIFLLKSKKLDYIGIFLGCMAIIFLSISHLLDIVPDPLLKFDEQPLGTLMVYMGAFFKMIFIDVFNFKPVAKLQHDISQKLQKPLIIQKNNTQHMDKTTFIRIIKSKFVNPLNIIIGFSSLLKHQSNEKILPIYQDYFSHIFDSSQEVLAKINIIISLANNKGNKFKPNLSCFNPVDPANNVHEHYLSLAEEKDITIILHYTTSSDYKLSSDQEAIEKILGNLLKNAIAYSPPNKNVKISISENNQEIIYSISDNGNGFSQKIIENFEISFDNEDNKKILGLGLINAKQITYALQGTIIPSNKNGAQVTVSIPHFNVETHSKIQRN